MCALVRVFPLYYKSKFVNLPNKMLNLLVISFGWVYNSINSTVGLDAIVKEAVLRVNVLSWGRQMASIPSLRGLGKCGPVIAETVWFDHRYVWFHID